MLKDVFNLNVFLRHRLQCICCYMLILNRYDCMQRKTICVKRSTCNEEGPSVIHCMYIYNNYTESHTFSVGASVSCEEVGNPTALTGINCAGMENNLLECTESGTLTSSDTCQYLARVSCTG